MASHRIGFLLMSLACLSTPLFAQTLHLSEFVASNKASLPDDDGAFSDWVEIYNPGASPVSLAGWRLTDDASDKSKWVFPSVAIPGKGFLVVFCSDKNRTDPAKPLHTNWKISASGEYLGLIRYDGTVASEYAPAFPPQQTDVSYGMAFSGGATQLLASVASARAIVPSNSALGTNWTARTFSDATWFSGKTGVGFERATGYEAEIGLDVGTIMYARNSTAYIRVPFDVNNPAGFDNLTLRMKYDDGFVAYLNGVKVAQANAPDLLSYNSQATTTHDDNLAVQFEDYDITAYRSALVAGTNVLAIHGLNAGSTSSDFLITPEIEASILGDVQPSVLRYFTVPTPGVPNQAAADSGPVVTSSQHTPMEPTDTQDVFVSARVTPTMSPLASVTLTYRVNYGVETTTPMYDDGAHGDGSSADGVYGARILNGVSAPAQMVRYFISAKDVDNRISRWPLFKSPTASPQYMGWMVRDTSVSSPLPVLYWWVQDPNAAKTEVGTQASIYYAGEFYDNVHVRLRGQSSAWWPKPHYKFDMNNGYYLRWSDSAPRAEEFNLQSTFSDKSYIRSVLSWETYRTAGVPYCETYPVRVQQNGVFHSVATFLEQPDERLMTRIGLDADGAFYKMYNECTDAYGGVEKKSRETEDNSDLAALIAGIQLQGSALERYLFDHVDVAETINYIAATAIMQDNDHVAKNYYLYRDTEGSGEWQFFPWDKDLTFGRNFWNWDVLNDVMVANIDPQSHPLFGDQQHPKIDGPWNRLIDALLRTPRIRSMYLRRLRTLMDDLLQAPGTPLASRKYEMRINQLVAAMSADVALDRAKWGNPYGEDQSFATAIAILKAQYLDVRRTHLFVTHSQNGGIVPPAQTPGLAIEIARIEPYPSSGNQDEEFIELVNPNSSAIDLSNWKVEGDVDHTIKPGTVLNPGESLYLSPNVRAFRARAVAPSGNSGLFVQGDVDGHMPREKQTIRLLRPDGSLADSCVTAEVQGTISLGGYSPEAPARTLSLVLKDGQGAVVESRSVSVGASSTFSFATLYRGACSISVQGGTWLKKTISGLTLSDTGLTGLSFGLVNGDVDGDNSVTVFDYAELSDAFDSAPGDPNWNARADLDGDGAVTVFDYAVLSESFDMVGD